MIKKETIADNIGVTPETKQFKTETSPDLDKKNFFQSFKIFNIPTGKGSVEDYDEHPLNFTRTRGMSHILRGVTGILGDLNKAIVDIVVGFCTETYNRFVKKPKGKIEKTKVTSDDLPPKIL